MNENMNQDTWKKSITPHGKNHSKTASKTTVSIYLNKNLVENARKHRLNLSKITEQALNSILDYLTQQDESESSKSLNPCSLPRENGWAGRSVWHDRRLRKAEAAGSNPARSTTMSYCILVRSCSVYRLVKIV